MSITNLETSPALDEALPRRKWFPLVAISLGTFMLIVDVTIVNVALPNMAAGLHTSFASLQWVVDGYAVALAALLLGIGSIADLVGLRRSYTVGLAVFAVASLACGFAPNSAVLISARVVQGVGGAAMLALTGALLNSHYHGRDRGVAFGWWGSVSGAAAAVGPILGGLLVEGLSWRWIFFVNVPLSGLAIAMTLRYLHADHGDRERRPDVLGTLTFTAAIALLTYAMIHANEHGWATTATYTLMAAAAVSLAAFVVIETHSTHAMLDLGLFANRSFLGTMIAALLTNFAAFAPLTYSAIWLETIIGLSPIQTGLTYLPQAGIIFVTSAVAGRFIHGQPRRVIAGGTLLIGIGSMLVTALLHPGSSWPALMPGFLIVGIGAGLAIPVLSSSAMSAVPPPRFGMASASVNAVRQLGYAIGVAVLGTVFSQRAASSLDHLAGSSALARDLAAGHAPRLLASAGTKRNSLDAALHLASISGLEGAFLVAGIGGVVAGLIAFTLIHPTTSSRKDRV